MKLKHNLILGAATTLLLTGCIDDKYDLSDIDTTTKLKINDLTIPVNLDPIVLDEIIKIKEGDQLKEITIDGQTFYAVEQSGDFYSDGVDVNAFEATPSPMEDKTAVFTPNKPNGKSYAKRNAGANTSMYYLMDPVYEDLEYSAEDIDGSIRELNDIYFKPMSFKINLSTTNIPSSISSELQDMKIKIPAGLTIQSIKAGGQSYAASAYTSDGMLSLNSVKLTNNKATIEIVATGISLASYPGAFTYDPKSDSGKLDLKSVFNIEDSQLELSGSASELANINSIVYSVSYSLDNLDAESVIAKIEYDLSGTGLYIEPINLENMPSFLENPHTNLILHNPQIYLKMMNPLGKYGLPYQSTLDIMALREGSRKDFVSPLIEVPKAEGTYYYLLAPEEENVALIPEKFNSDQIIRQKYPDLNNLLAGEGLPQMLDIDIVDPIVPPTTTTAPFELNQSIEGMEGEYQFIAPLALEQGSKIVKTIDGWWTEDLADLNIEYLTLEAEALNELPTGVILYIEAIDRDLNPISSTATQKLELSSDPQKLDITLKPLNGEVFNNLDGLQLYVIAGENHGEPLAPDQVITLSNLKAKVSGYYLRKL